MTTGDSKMHRGRVSVKTRYNTAQLASDRLTFWYGLC